MQARSEVAALIPGGLLLAGCMTDPSRTPGPVVIAPAVAPWSCAEQQQAKAELQAMPAGAVLPRMLGDYLRRRDESRAARNETAQSCN